ncbi:hypothetical protein [Streptomyces sp. NPDC026673]|uniref:hypothetical protein n=1 Tax=Streptomyces sp. NPDC026673 TaxID=3155724 RepID=UPI0033F35322
MTQPLHLWLAALDGSVPVSEMRAYWNSKDDPTPALDAAMRKGAYLYLGTWADHHESDEPQQARCPALRVADWLFWRGTVPRYALPTLSDELATELVGCFEPRTADLPATAADTDEFTAFLAGHRGNGILTVDEGAVPQEHRM